MKTAGTTRLGNRLAKRAPRIRRRLTDEISQALGEQTVEVGKLMEAHPLQPVLTRMPEVGVRTAARLLTEGSARTSPRRLRRSRTRHPAFRLLNSR
jgi:hypothetical protein